VCNDPSVASLYLDGMAGSINRNVPTEVKYDSLKLASRGAGDGSVNAGNAAERLDLVH
jgi:hypothetical protein